MKKALILVPAVAILAACGGDADGEDAVVVDEGVGTTTTPGTYTDPAVGGTGTMGDTVGMGTGMGADTMGMGTTGTGMGADTAGGAAGTTRP